uniref:Secreted protein n=1 Tax=Phytophthora fragariae TaxID=53985 RepID=A0A6A3D6Y5_9STRA|nr:hypothetical protein PF009_g32414 [Phytophthora fragariae]
MSWTRTFLGRRWTWRCVLGSRTSFATGTGATARTTQALSFSPTLRTYSAFVIPSRACSSWCLIARFPH